MAGTIQCGRRSRKDFGKIPSIVEIPNLIEVQKRSYETFLQKDVSADRREDVGLQAVFKSVFPIADYNDNALLEFDSYHFGDPKYTVEELSLIHISEPTRQAARCRCNPRWETPT